MRFAIWDFHPAILDCSWPWGFSSALIWWLGRRIGAQNLNQARRSSEKSLMKFTATYSRRIFTMFITEIFKSIQGEGTRAGLPCIFVRLTGCNLRCTWCDTAYAFHGGKKMTVAEVCRAGGRIGRPLATTCAAAT